MQGTLPLLPLLTGADGGTVGDDISPHTSSLHLLQQMKGALQLLPFLTGADGGTVGDDVRPHTSNLHLLQQVHGAGPLLGQALLAAL